MRSILRRLIPHIVVGLSLCTNAIAGEFHSAGEEVPTLSAEQSFLPDDHYFDLLKLGHEQLKKKDYKQSIKIYSKAIKYKPDLAYAYLRRGYANKEIGKIKQARRDYQSAIDAASLFITLNPQDAANLYNRGDAYYRLGKTDLAEKDLLMAKDDPFSYILLNRITLDRTRGQRWKPLVVSDAGSFYYYLNDNGNKYKNVWTRSELYENDLKKQVLPEYLLEKYRTNINDVGYFVVNYDIKCRGRFYRPISAGYYTYDSDLIHEVSDGQQDFRPVLPDTDLHSMTVKICE